MKRRAPLVLLFLAACHRGSAPVEVWIPPAPSEEAAVAASSAPTAGPVAPAAAPAPAAEVFSPISGRIVAVSVRLGQRVKKGDALATVDSPEGRASTGALHKAEADLIAAERDYKRQKQLCEACCTQRDLEMADDRYRQAKAELERARAKARLLKPTIDGYVLRAPLGGEVLALGASLGQEVSGMPTGGNVVPLFVIGERAPASAPLGP
jgi:multidrug efflux pump subunit AcrA (membrane-fusion protein)